MTYLFLSFAGAIFFHLISGALTAHFFGIKILELSYGTGPKIIGIGKVTIKLIPISGYVKMLDSREIFLDEHELEFAYDLKPSLVRAFTVVSGNIFLVLIAGFLIGKQAFESFFSSFVQIILFILSPTQDAQIYIQDILNFTQTNSFITIFSITATKISAIYLLPIPVLNGGNALLELTNINEKHKILLFKIGISIILLMLLSVSIAITDFIWF